jgi:acetyl-CoA carboxylase biotin carboxyl carrier protein
MEEFHLDEALLEGDGWKVAFRRSNGSAPAPESQPLEESPQRTANEALVAATVTPAGPAGEPLTTPMTGIYYSSPSPNAPPFVREGEEVEEGQVVALIEAMKVFNEIVAPAYGRITKLVAQSAQIVQAGDVLMYIDPASE